MVIGKVELGFLGFLGLGHLGPVLFLGMENLKTWNILPEGEIVLEFFLHFSCMANL